MKFSEVIGHDQLKRMLVRSVDEGRISHAQLFTGRSGYGALPLALAYAQYVNCTGRADGNSCGECPSCRKISGLAHPDLHFVFPVNSSKEGSSQKAGSDNFLPQWRELFGATGGYFDEPMWFTAINIENKQAIISRAEADAVVRKLSLKAFEAAYKVMIVWLPERMRPEASNALLKILEEPWERTLFLLVSEEPERLLPTILSRTQQVSVPGISRGDVEAYLTGNMSLAAERATEISRLAVGSITEARRLAADEGEGGARDYFDMFAQLMRLSYNDRHMELLEWGEGAASLGREDQKRFLLYSASMLRDSYMMNAGMDEITYLSGNELAFGRNFSPFIGNHNIEKLVAEMETAIRQVTQNGNPRIIFPHLALAVSKLIIRK